MSKIQQNFRLYRDGTAWCATAPGFRNLAIDPAGFGDTQEEAIADLQHQLGEKLDNEDFKVGGYCRRCREWVPSGTIMDGCRDPDCEFSTRHRLAEQERTER